MLYVYGKHKKSYLSRIFLYFCKNYKLRETSTNTILVFTYLLQSSFRCGVRHEAYDARVRKTAHSKNHIIIWGWICIVECNNKNTSPLARSELNRQSTPFIDRLGRYLICENPSANTRFSHRRFDWFIKIYIVAIALRCSTPTHQVFQIDSSYFHSIVWSYRSDINLLFDQ